MRQCLNTTNGRSRWNWNEVEQPAVADPTRQQKAKAHSQARHDPLLGI
jgi:hypothetical protein